jgi:hypothetical protein
LKICRSWKKNTKTKISKKPNFYDPSVGSQKKNFLKTKKYRYLLADRLGPYLIIELVAGPVSILQQVVLNIKNPKRKRINSFDNENKTSKFQNIWLFFYRFDDIMFLHFNFQTYSLLILKLLLSSSNTELRLICFFLYFYIWSYYFKIMYFPFKYFILSSDITYFSWSNCGWKSLVQYCSV